MNTTKINFLNGNGENLAARLEMPLNRAPVSFAIFAHCFTCNKNLTAVKNISRGLTANGIAVLRFDFTGLGESEGDFTDTNFSSNVDDLIAAAEFLKKEYIAPSILIGHSLGGAAVIFAASQLTDIKAVVTIGAPSDPVHVRHLLDSGSKEIEEKGIANVNIGGRPFTIKKQFVDDLLGKDMKVVLSNLRKPILVMHSPQDATVEVKNAADIYGMARHPKSFVSLDGADHLLSNKADSHYVGEVIGSWVKRYIDFPDKKRLSSNSQIVASLADGFTTDIMAGDHFLVADEPESVGGNNYGPNPYELLSSSLAACTVMTLQMYARRKNWDLKEVIVHIDHSKDYAKDCENLEDNKGKIDRFVKQIELRGELDEQQQKRLLEIADKCPVHKTLHNTVEVETTLKQ